jgi:hypothetical protein
VTDLRKSFFLVAAYLLTILLLGWLDSIDRPVINFASYFYLLALVSVAVMIFIPTLHKVSVIAPMVFWGAIYFAIPSLVDRSRTADTAVEILLLEFVMIQSGVWLGYKLATAIDRSESFMDILAMGTFPHRAVELGNASEMIKVEFSRSRRYHRPLSLLVIHAVPADDEVAREMLKNLQRDMLARLSNSRVGQAVSASIRQTDLLIRDQIGRYLILCPETNLESARLLGKRISQIVEERTGMFVKCGGAAFPDEALTFEDLLYLARERSEKVKPNENKTV